jgi:hypothetical protein
MLAARHRPNKIPKWRKHQHQRVVVAGLPAILDDVTASRFNGPVDWKLLVTRRPVGNQLIRARRNGPIKTAAQGSSRFASQLKRRLNRPTNSSLRYGSIGDAFIGKSMEIVSVCHHFDNEHPPDKMAA